MRDARRSIPLASRAIQNVRDVRKGAHVNRTAEASEGVIAKGESDKQVLAKNYASAVRQITALLYLTTFRCACDVRIAPLVTAMVTKWQYRGAETAFLTWRRR